MSRNKKSKGWYKKVQYFFLAIIFLAVAGLACCYLIEWHMDKFAKAYIVDVNNAPAAEAVMVLGAFVYSSGEPSPVLRDRLDYGYEIYKAGKAKKILVSGDHGTRGYDEVNAMKNYLLSKGLPAQDIFLDHAGFNTYDSMYRARDVFDIKTMIISTQQFHISRSIYIARVLGIDAYGYPSEDKEIYSMQYLNFRESLAKVKAFFDVRVIGRQPKFLGETIPISGDGRETDDKTKFGVK